MSVCIGCGAQIEFIHMKSGRYMPVDPEPDYDVMDKYERREKREALEQWVFGGGPEPCHKLIDEVWNGG